MKKGSCDVIQAFSVQRPVHAKNHTLHTLVVDERGQSSLCNIDDFTPFKPNDIQGFVETRGMAWSL